MHVLVRFGRGITQSEWVKEMKRVSSLWIKSQNPALSDFSWQSGYGIFSVSVSSLDQVEAYIHNQEEHHQNISGQDEQRMFHPKPREPCEERYGRD